jgi:phosphoserine phosphatase RsbU/P
MRADDFSGVPPFTIGRRAVLDISISRVLIVDDDEDMRILLGAHLEELGYVVSTVPDGETSLQWLEANAADLLFLDLSMTGMDGLDVLKHIRERGFDVAVILTTAHGSEEIAVEALRIGADDYLRKPFGRHDLRMVLDRAIQKLSLFRHNVLLRRQLGVELSRAAEIQADATFTTGNTSLVKRSASPSATSWERAYRLHS